MPIGLAEFVSTAGSYKGPQRFGVSRDDIESDLLSTSPHIGHINCVGRAKVRLGNALGIGERHRLSIEIRSANDVDDIHGLFLRV
jgi:hypothetical protein